MQRSIADRNRADLAAPQHKNAVAFLRLSPDRRPSNGQLLEALDLALGGRQAVQDAVGAKVVGLSSGLRMHAVVALWEEHCVVG